MEKKTVSPPHQIKSRSIIAIETGKPELRPGYVSIPPSNNSKCISFKTTDVRLRREEQSAEQQTWRRTNEFEETPASNRSQQIWRMKARL